MKLDSIVKGAQISDIEEGKVALVPIHSLFTQTLERCHHRIHQRSWPGEG